MLVDLGGGVHRLSGGLVRNGDLPALDALGLRRLIDLRGPGEDRALLQRWAGDRYVWLPIDAGAVDDLARAAVHADTPEAAEALMGRLYRGVVDQHGEQFAAALEVVSEGGPVAFGCAAGKDRTGILAALLGVLRGYDEERIVADYVTTPLPPAVLRQLVDGEFDVADAPQLDVLLGTSEARMRETLAHVRDAHGGVEAYLLSHGLTPAALERLPGQAVRT